MVAHEEEAVVLVDEGGSVLVDEGGGSVLVDVAVPVVEVVTLLY